MQVLTADSVKQAARLYLERGLLAAQNPDFHIYGCQYGYPDSRVRCAIGAVFDDAMHDRIMASPWNGDSISTLAAATDEQGHPYITFQSAQDRAVAIDVQWWHDQWLNGEATEDDFRRAIGLD